jgi:hypothetical protein
VQNPGDFDFVQSWIFNSYLRRNWKMYNNDYIEFLKNEFAVASVERIKEYWDFYNSKDVSPDFVVAFESYFGIG